VEFWLSVVNPHEQHAVGGIKEVGIVAGEPLALFQSTSMDCMQKVALSDVQ
jgi:hypothetical protein